MGEILKQSLCPVNKQRTNATTTTAEGGNLLYHFGSSTGKDIWGFIKSIGGNLGMYVSGATKLRGTGNNTKRIGEQIHARTQNSLMLHWRWRPRQHPLIYFIATPAAAEDQQNFHCTIKRVMYSLRLIGGMANRMFP